MKKSLFQKSLAAFLAMLMLLSAFAVIPVSALSSSKSSADAADDSAESDISYGSIRNVEEIKKFLGTIDYTDYDAKYADIPKADKTVVIQAAEYYEAETDAKVEVKNNFEGMDGKSLYTPNEGTVAWKVNIPKTGRYAIRIVYYPEPGTYTTIERMVFVDGQLPFSESRYYYFPRVWAYEYSDPDTLAFDKDRNGNDIRPIREESPSWQTYYLRDWLGYTMTPFEYYLTEGEHILSFKATREPMTLARIELYPYVGEPTYEEFLADKQAQGVKIIETLADPIRVQAENPFEISNACLYPTNDRTSALTEPQDPAVMKYNLLNATTVNQWMKYIVEVPETGLYRISARFRQNDLIGMFTSRRLYVNGEIQFDEASHLRFKFSPEWQSLPLNNGKEDFLFYLEKGKNELTFEVVLGDMTDYVYRIEQLINVLNDAYESILLLTGPVPDNYRDYGFSRLVPDSIVTIGNAALELTEIADALKDVTGEKGDQIEALEMYAELFNRMASDEYEIAPNFVTFKNYIISLSNWLYSSLNQPMKFDSFTVAGSNDPLPQAKANFLQAAWFEIRAFFMSFFMDYTTVGFKSEVKVEPENTVEMWIANATNGRDDALIQRGLIDKYFTPNSGIAVTIKVITAGLTEAILAGIGPDVSSMDSVNTITWGLRHAVEELNPMPGFDEVMSWFSDAASMPLTLDGKTYGLPSGMSFFMTFYRVDVFTELGLKVPTTWQELYDIIPALQNSNMQVSLPSALESGGVSSMAGALAGLNIFLYQSGAELYRENGLRINLDSNEALDAFETYCDMFTKYKCPTVPDLSRFRTGEIPLMISDGVGTYNSLMGFYELRGLWEMSPLLGMMNEEGELNFASPVTVAAHIIPRGANNPVATWEYLKWLVSEDTQILEAKETLAVSANPTTKPSSANLNALLKFSWTDYEREALEKQLSQLIGIHEYPGNYIVGTYVSAAFNAVYSNSTDPSTELLDRILYINKEISRKRREFHMDYYDLNSTQNGEWVLIEGDRAD